MSTLKISLVQTPLAWHDPGTNRAALERLVLPHAGAADLVVLPEMFTTGFTMTPREVAESAGGPTLDWMRNLAARMDAAVTGSVVTREDGRYLNRLSWVEPDGRSVHYDKRHLFRMTREHEHYTAGRRRLIVEWRGFRVCPLVCYDLRFPVWSRNRRMAPYDLLLFVANWPATRRTAWQRLLPARAIENLCYVAGVNCVGTDGVGVDYAGDTVVHDWRGEALLAMADETGVGTVELDGEALERFRQKFPAQLDADDFELLE